MSQGVYTSHHFPQHPSHPHHLLHESYTQKWFLADYVGRQRIWDELLLGMSYLKSKMVDGTDFINKLNY